MIDKALFVRRCFDLARLGNGSTSPNPSVGAVITDGNIIVGEGWHQQYGQAHAEVNAVRDWAADHTTQSVDNEIFTSLEPCFHFGKTPPCTDLILNNKIPKATTAYLDPNPLVGGKGFEKLKNNGVKTTVLPPQNAQYADATLSPFFINMSKKRPYIILKWAESADGFISKRQERTAISNAYAQRLTHKWRSEADAICVGFNTVMVDNPALTNRFYFGKNPVRITFDRNGSLPHTAALFDGSVPTFVFTEGVQSHLPNVNFIPLNFDDNWLNKALDILFKSHKIGIVLVEGGAKLHEAFIRQNLWDEMRFFKSPNLLGAGVKAPDVRALGLPKVIQIHDNQLFMLKNK